MNNEEEPVVNGLFSTENHQYNLVLKEYLETGNAKTFEEFVLLMSKVMTHAIEVVKQNINDGDAHILLADVFQHFGLICGNSDENEVNHSRMKLYFANIKSSAAVIYHWKVTPMYSRNKLVGEELYSAVEGEINRLNIILAQTNNKTLSMSGLHQELYEAILSLNTK
jgi:hypothetical protein